MKNRKMLWKKIVTVSIMGAISFSGPVGTLNVMAEVSENMSETEKEAIYITATKIALVGFDYEYAAKELRKIEGYKDSAELADKYEHLAESRYYNDNFYWTPEALAKDLNYELEAREIEHTEPYIEAGTNENYYIKLNYKDDDITITLYGVDEQEGCFKSIEFAGYQYSSNLAVLFIYLLNNEQSVENGKTIVQNLMDTFMSNGASSTTENGITYSFYVNDSDDFVFGAKGENDTSSTVEYSDIVTVKKVQELLNDKGYNCGTADGIAGQKTKDAISAYESASGITVNGIITDELLQSLGLK